MPAPKPAPEKIAKVIRATVNTRDGADSALLTAIRLTGPVRFGVAAYMEHAASGDAVVIEVDDTGQLTVTTEQLRSGELADPRESAAAKPWGDDAGWDPDLPAGAQESAPVRLDIGG